jgi:hypothetical protein
MAHDFVVDRFAGLHERVGDAVGLDEMGAERDEHFSHDIRGPKGPADFILINAGGTMPVLAGGRVGPNCHREHGVV